MSANTCILTILEIRKLSRFLDKYSKYLNNNHNVTLPQMLCLYELSKAESMNLTELTRLINLNNSAITGIVDRLEAKNFVRRIKKEGDRRTIHLEITEKGREFTQSLMEIMDNECFLDEKKLNNISSEDMLRSLVTITNALDPNIKKIEI
jgi:DNA-binding MarR family transcriptional regulator